jgi:hypothetical protein
MQRDRCIVSQPARFDDATAARVETGKRFFQAFAAQTCSLFGFEHHIWCVIVGSQVGNRCELFAFVITGGFQRQTSLIVVWLANS